MINQIEWRQEITVRFWLDDGSIPDNHLSALEEAGFQKAHEMISEGFTSGELSENIPTEDAPIDGIDYSGWWKLSTQTVEDKQQ